MTATPRKAIRQKRKQPAKAGENQDEKTGQSIPKKTSKWEKKTKTKHDEKAKKKVRNPQRNYSKRHKFLDE